MNVQFLEKDGQPEFAVIPIGEYRALLDLVEDACDSAALDVAARSLRAGELDLVPSVVVDRLLAGEPPVRVWREHRGLSAAQLADRIGVTPAHVSKLENRRGQPSVGVLKKIANALDVDLDTLVGPEP